MRTFRTVGLLGVISGFASMVSSCASQGAVGGVDTAAVTSRSDASVGGQSMGPQVRATALAAAHRAAAQESDKPTDASGWPTNVANVSAVVRPGTVRDSNTGHPCESGQLIVITLVGDWDNVGVAPTPQPHGAAGTSNDAVRAMIATVDLEGGQVCLISAQTDPGDPEPGATTLYSR